MTGFSWVLGPLTVLLLTVICSGAMGMVDDDTATWVDYLFWTMMFLGTLPAAVLLTRLQVRWLWQRLGNQARRDYRTRSRPASRI